MIRSGRLLRPGELARVPAPSSHLPMREVSMKRPGGANTAKPVGLQRAICRRWRRAGAALAFIVGLLVAGGALGEGPSRPSREQLKLGLDLFTHEWEPSDPLCHGGDGLGPVYNETSCVACHGQGGVGGAGPAGMNVEVLTSIGTELGAGSLYIAGAARSSRFEDGDSKVEIRFDSSGSLLRPFTPEETRLLSMGGTATTINVHFSKDAALSWFRHGFVITAKGTTLRTQEFDVRINLTKATGVSDLISAANTVPSGVRSKTTDASGAYSLSCAEGSIDANSFTVKPDDDALRTIHPALVDTPSTVLHHFGVDHRYAKWRSHLKSRLPAPRSRNTTQLALAGGSIVASQRNSPPPFRSGLDRGPSRPGPARNGRGGAGSGSRAGQYHEERTHREIRLEGPDDEPAGICPGRLRQRARPGGARTSSGDLSAGPGREGGGPGSDSAGR